MRRKSEANNSKHILQTLINLMIQNYENRQCVVPSWFEDSMVGYGDSDSASFLENSSKFSDISCQYSVQYWGDTFLSNDHVKSVMQNADPKYSTRISGECHGPPYEIEFDDENKQVCVRHCSPFKITTLMNKELLQNTIQFNRRQVDAIRSAMMPGLSLIVGPPGTGKTDVAVQTMLNLFRNNPNEKLVIVTHSNTALNQIFEKLIDNGFPEEFLIRLGHGEVDLKSEKNFSRMGRVDYILKRRKELLESVRGMYQIFLLLSISTSKISILEARDCSEKNETRSNHIK